MKDCPKEFSCKNENRCPYTKKINELKEELAYVRFELEQLRSKRYKAGKKPPSNELDKNNPVPRKRGGLFGHAGWFRKKPSKPDRIEEVKLDSCPKCGSKDITECEKIDEHIQEDIILPKVEAVLYRRHHYYCRACKKVVSSKGKDELANSYIGPKAKAFAAFLRYGIKISERDVQILFERAFNLKIVASSIAGFRYQLKRAGAPLYRILKESLKKGAFIHADETGWKINGKTSWLWKFSNKKVSLSHIDESKGKKVVEKVIGDNNGVLLSFAYLKERKERTSKTENGILTVPLAIRLCRNVILSDSEGSRFFTYRRDSSAALLLQNDRTGIFRNYDTV